jgi:hypothetical protein
MIKALIDAAFEDGLVHLKDFHFQHSGNDKPIIVVAAAPRTGSTFLSIVLQEVTKLQRFRLCSGYATNEHDLYLPALCIVNDSGCISQMHMKGSFHNASLINRFKIRQIILVRNIYDIVASLFDDLRKKEETPGYHTGENGYSFLWLDSATKNMNDEDLIDMIIDLAIPWYVNFYVSWHRLAEQNIVNPIWVNYEDMMNDKNNTIISILNFIDFPFNGEINSTILNRKYNTYNKGGSGRGNILLSDERKKRIMDKFSYYKDVNFDRYFV